MVGRWALGASRGEVATDLGCAISPRSEVGGRPAAHAADPAGTFAWGASSQLELHRTRPRNNRRRELRIADRRVAIDPTRGLPRSKADSWRGAVHPTALGILTEGVVIIVVIENGIAAGRKRDAAGVPALGARRRHVDVVVAFDQACRGRAQVQR